MNGEKESQECAHALPSFILGLWKTLEKLTNWQYWGNCSHNRYFNIRSGKIKWRVNSPCNGHLIVRNSDFSDLPPPSPKKQEKQLDNFSRQCFSGFRSKSERRPLLRKYDNNFARGPRAWEMVSTTKSINEVAKKEKSRGPLSIFGEIIATIY